MNAADPEFSDWPDQPTRDQVLIWWYSQEPRHSVDKFTASRVLWEEVHNFLLDRLGRGISHNKIKRAVALLCKDGVLGKTDYQEAITADGRRKANKRRYGNTLGPDKVAEKIESWANGYRRKKVSEFYQNYMASQTWIDRRDRYLNENCKVDGGFKCELCGNVAATLQVHHNDYSILDGMEPDQHLCGVCREPCHDAADVCRSLRKDKQQDAAERNDAFRPLFKQES